MFLLIPDLVWMRIPRLNVVWQPECVQCSQYPSWTWTWFWYSHDLNWSITMTWMHSSRGLADYVCIQCSKSTSLWTTVAGCKCCMYEYLDNLMSCLLFTDSLQSTVIKIILRSSCFLLDQKNCDRIWGCTLSSICIRLSNHSDSAAITRAGCTYCQHERCWWGYIQFATWLVSLLKIRVSRQHFWISRMQTAIWSFLPFALTPR